jgi:hypothetical protein
MSAGDVLDGHPHLTTGAPLHRSSREPPQPDLGSLQIGEDSHRPAALVAGLPNHGVDPRVLSVAGVAEVQPCHVHTGPDQLPDLLRGRRDRADRTDNLRVSTHNGQARLPKLRRRIA